MKYFWTHRPEMLFDTAEAVFDYFCEEPINLLNGDEGYVDSISEEELAQEAA